MYFQLQICALCAVHSWMGKFFFLQMSKLTRVTHSPKCFKILSWSFLHGLPQICGVEQSPLYKYGEWYLRFLFSSKLNYKFFCASDLWSIRCWFCRKCTKNKLVLTSQWDDPNMVNVWEIFLYVTQTIYNRFFYGLVVCIISGKLKRQQEGNPSLEALLNIRKFEQAGEGILSICEKIPSRLCLSRLTCHHPSSLSLFI